MPEDFSIPDYYVVPVAVLLAAAVVAILAALWFRIKENGEAARTDAEDRKATKRITARAFGDPYDVEDTPDEPARADGALSLAAAAAILRASEEQLRVPAAVDLDVVVAEVVQDGEDVPLVDDGDPEDSGDLDLSPEVARLIRNRKEYPPHPSIEWALHSDATGSFKGGDKRNLREALAPEAVAQ